MKIELTSREIDRLQQVLQKSIRNNKDDLQRRIGNEDDPMIETIERAMIEKKVILAKLRNALKEQQK